LAAHDWKGHGGLPETSNGYCHPGKAGGLPSLFTKIHAADVSDHHIRVANDYLKESGIDNVDFVWLKEMDDLRALPQFDFFFSFIVLQHNPPPVQLAILETVLAKVKKRRWLPVSGCDGNSALFLQCGKLSEFRAAIQF
jgi:hypothetical protein